MEHEVISRAEAIALCRRRYFTGKSCKHGHVAERQVWNGNCCECHRTHDRAYDEANREKRLAYFRARYAANKDKWLVYARPKLDKVAATRR